MVTILSNQSLFDIAVQAGGSVESVFLAAVENGISVTDELQTGAEIFFKSIINKDIVKYYADKNLKPATWPSIEADTPGGIGHMAIEINFIVS